MKENRRKGTREKREGRRERESVKEKGEDERRTWKGKTLRTSRLLDFGNPTNGTIVQYMCNCILGAAYLVLIFMDRKENYQ